MTNGLRKDRVDLMHEKIERIKQALMKERRREGKCRRSLMAVASIQYIFRKNARH
jgi:hypothetical protein